MPCFTKIQTLLIDLATLEAAAKVLGITVTKRTANSYTLKRGNEQVGIERIREGEKFYVAAMSGTNNFQKEILEPLTTGYAKERVKQFAKTKGYTVAAGTKAGEYILTKYG